MNGYRPRLCTPIRAPLGLQLSGMSLPLLDSVLDYLKEWHEFKAGKCESIFIEWIDLLSQVLHASLHLTDVENDCSLSDTTADLMTRYNSFTQKTRTARSAIEAPPFVDLWVELISTCSCIQAPSSTYSTLLCGYVVVSGQRMKGHQALAFEYTQHCDAKYTPLINAILRDQPVYTDMPIEPLRMNKDPRPRSEEFLVLYYSIRDFAGNRGSDSGVINMVFHFCMLLAYTIDLFAATSYTPSSAQKDVLLETTVKAWVDVTSDIFSGTPWEVRSRMAQSSVRGITEALVHKCRVFLQDNRSNSTLGYRLYAWFFAKLASALDRCEWPIPVRQHFIAAASSGEFGFSPFLSPREDFVLNGCRHFRLDRDRLGVMN